MREEKRRVLWLILTMVCGAVIILGVSLTMLYQTALQEEEARLVETAQSQARLIEAIARFDARYSCDYPEGAAAATLSQIRDVHHRYEGFGETGEFTLARREGDQIVFLVNHRHGDRGLPAPIPFDSDLAEPMRRALSGESGTVIGLDYRGETVFTAHEPVAELGWGIVAKIDLAEVRGPFIRAGIAAALCGLLVMGMGTGLFLRITTPMVARLQRYAEELKEQVDARTRELHDAQERLVRQEKLAVLGQLAGGVGHELRNPLGVINNAVYYLRMVLTDADETTREYLDIIDAEVRGAEKIVSDLLDFSRVKSVDRTETAVSELVARFLEIVSPSGDVEVVTEVPAGVGPVLVDPGQIEQVLINLIANGCQAMPEGGQLRIAARAEGDRVALSVTDTGGGIPDENLDKVFEPLFTTRARGIGLGLAVSRTLVEANGGSLEVESEVGRGSTFTVFLPTREVLA